MARFDSDCAECFARIFEGDDARYKDGEVVCEQCGSNEQNEEHQT
jgi:uncharacterized Zn finger protein (UPF0148 family)